MLLKFNFLNLKLVSVLGCPALETFTYPDIGKIFSNAFFKKFVVLDFISKIWYILGRILYFLSGMVGWILRCPPSFHILLEYTLHNPWICEFDLLYSYYYVSLKSLFIGV